MPRVLARQPVAERAEDGARYTTPTVSRANNSVNYRLWGGTVPNLTNAEKSATERPEKTALTEEFLPAADFAVTKISPLCSRLISVTSAALLTVPADPRAGKRQGLVTAGQLCAAEHAGLADFPGGVLPHHCHQGIG